MPSNACFQSGRSISISGTAALIGALFGAVSCAPTDREPEPGVDSTNVPQVVEVSRPDQILRIRSFPAQRVTAVNGMSYFPVIARLRDSSIAVVLRGAGAHIGRQGRLRASSGILDLQPGDWIIWQEVSPVFE